MFSGQEEGSMAGVEPPSVTAGQEVRLGLVCLGSTMPMQDFEVRAAVDATRVLRSQHGSTLGRPLPHDFLSPQHAYLVGKEP